MASGASRRDARSVGTDEGLLLQLLDVASLETLAFFEQEFLLKLVAHLGIGQGLVVRGTFVLDEENPEAPQTKMPELHGADRKQSFIEVELGFTMEEAVKEATRCLRCDVEV